MDETGTLSIVATPIGNLGDITLRAIETLRVADVIFCEDTRVTGKLLQHLSLPKTELVRADAEKEAEAATYALQLLAEGKHIAYVSDAGTPGVSDPGGRLIARVREANARVEVIPGPSALTAAIALSGLSGTTFTFLGFVPHKKGRQTFFTNVAAAIHPVIFFESPHRIVKTLEALMAHCPAATVSLARELTKMHEELLVGTPAQVYEQLEADPNKQRGEMVVVVDPS